MRKIMLFSITLLVGCFAPDLTATQLLCDESHFCPDGFSCIAGICQLGSGSGGTDGGGGSLTSGCADGKGTDVSGGTVKPAWACPGTYQADGDRTKNAARLCAAGYDICTTAATINQSTCNNLNGFFLANSPVRAQGTNNTACTTAATTGGQTAAWAGCGKTIYSVGSAPDCGGFTRAMYDLAGNGLRINSPFSPLAGTTQNDSSTNGVLCCKN